MDKSNFEAKLNKSRLLQANGEFEAALNVAQQIVAVHPSEPGILEHLFSLYSALGRDQESIDVLMKLETVSTLSATQNCQLSSLLAKKGSPNEAIKYAAEAARLEPRSAFFMNQYAGLLISVDQAQKAVTLLLEALKRDKSNASILRQLSVGCEKLGKAELALDFAKHAYNCEPSNVDLLLHSSSLMIKAEQFHDAARQLEDALSRGMQHEFIFMLLSSAYQQTGQKQDALAVVKSGIALLGKTPDLMLHEGIVLCSLTQFYEAIEIFNSLVVINPDNTTARTACVAALTVTGRTSEAISHCAYLLSKNPTDASLRNNIRQLLNQMPSGNLGDEPVSNFFAQRKLFQRSQRHARKKESPLAKQMRIVGALTMREARTRFRQSKLNYAWVLFEPLAHIGIMIALINTFAHGPPPLGESFAVFYFTGIIPYHLFTHTSGYLLSSISGNKPLLLMPTVTPFDVTAARAIVEFANELSVALVLMLVFTILGLGALPINPLGVFGAFLLIWIAGFGMGMINCILSIRFHGWDKIWGATAALLYFASGTFYIPSMMPEWVRNILVWNPVLQGIELVRANYFNEVVPRWLDPVYLAFIAGMLFCVGLLMIQASKRQTSNA